MKKGTYLPTGQNIVVTKEVNDYCEILIDGNFKMVSISEFVSRCCFNQDKVNFIFSDLLKG